MTVMTLDQSVKMGKHPYKVRIVNTMFGYERDQVRTIWAADVDAALAKGHEIDEYADVYLVDS